ncbi:DNA replication protein psf1 [Dimargaris xerosporica]|nr:DNA replication protein psf1 [Dimargaris xerosporica]
MNSGTHGIKLIAEAKRTARHLPAYNEALVQHVLRETTHQFSRLEELLRTVDELSGADPNHTRRIAAQMALLHANVKWNKRCLLAYHQQRVAFLKRLFWSLGCLPDELRDHLPPQELDYFSHYILLINQYKSNYVDVGLTASPIPPKDLYIEVRVLQECGEIQVEDGTLMLTKNSQHLVKRSDVEHLIQRGLLEHIR